MFLTPTSFSYPASPGGQFGSNVNVVAEVTVAVVVVAVVDDAVMVLVPVVVDMGEQHTGAWAAWAPSGSLAALYQTPLVGLWLTFR
jgi:hypothetical protein